MPVYHPMRSWLEADRTRAIERLLALRAGLREAVPGKADGKLLLATWNLRDFDVDRFGWGLRLDESILYIAEIVAKFDLVAVQEVNRDLTGLHRLMAALGGDWRYLATDTTEGRGGHGERMAFLYDAARVRFRGIAGEVVLPEGQEIVVPDADAGDGDGQGDGARRIQFARSPFVTAFQAGWYKFNLATVHIYYGDTSGAKFRRRVDEIRAIAEFFARRQAREAEDFILLGDFNIVSHQDETMAALKAGGFRIPPGLAEVASNLSKTRFYDQIALRTRDKRVEIRESGGFTFDDFVFRPAAAPDIEAYRRFMPADKLGDGNLADAYDTWRSYQMSDHYPLWAQFQVDFTDDYLESLRPGMEPLT